MLGDTDAISLAFKLGFCWVRSRKVSESDLKGSREAFSRKVFFDFRGRGPLVFSFGLDYSNC